MNRRAIWCFLRGEMTQIVEWNVIYCRVNRHISFCEVNFPLCKSLFTGCVIGA